MSKRIFLAAFLMTLLSSAVFAIDEDGVAIVHNKTRETLTRVCNSRMKDLNQQTCACLGDKAQANIDDNILGQCPNRGGRVCVRQVVEIATIQALSKDSILSCMSQVGQPIPTASQNAPTATYQPPLSPSNLR